MLRISKIDFLKQQWTCSKARGTGRVTKIDICAAIVSSVIFVAREMCEGAQGPGKSWGKSEQGTSLWRCLSMCSLSILMLLYTRQILTCPPYIEFDRFINYSLHSHDFLIRL